MNLRMFSIALMASVIPMSVSAGSSAVSLTPGDFISSKRVLRNGEEVVQVKLSKSGKAKLKKLSEGVDKE